MAPRRPRRQQGDLFGAPPEVGVDIAAAGEPEGEDPSRGDPPGPGTTGAGRRPRRSPRAEGRHAAGGTFDVALQVCVPAWVGALHYGWRSAQGDPPAPGCRVSVPLRGRLVVGMVWAHEQPDQLDFAVERLRPIASVLDEAPLWNPALMTTLAQLAAYYHVPLGQMVRTALPAPLRRTGFSQDQDKARLEDMAAIVEGARWPTDLRKAELRVLERLSAEGELAVRMLRRRRDPLSGGSVAVSVPGRMLESLQDKGLLRLWQRRVMRDPLGLRASVPRDTPFLPTYEQAAALDQLTPRVRAGGGAFLLRGVTGSGKTEVYLRLIAEALREDEKQGPAGGAIVLVPEIALTPQLVSRFRARFGDRVAVLHSAMSEGERFDQFTRIRRGDSPIVIGPRSALFAPLPRLAVIVLDECHDASFKQQSGVRYHARDAALLLAAKAGAVCLLGSATPGCEELKLADDGRIGRIDLPLRVAGRPMPEAHCIDLRVAERVAEDEQGRPSLLSRELVDAIAATAARGEQALLLHNRRGYAASMICCGCGSPMACPHCAVSFTLHRRAGRMRCHYCATSAPLEASCPQCGGRNLLAVGAGTERIEETLLRHVPGLRVARFDRDTATGGRLLDLLDRFGRRELDVLVGTQMLAKGHDFPAVTLVGVVLAEQGLRIPDFRAAERTFQLLTQVAGRAGRAELPGRVMVQTFAPEHRTVVDALAHDHDSFSQEELRWRAQLAWPPFVHLALIETRAAQAELAQSTLAQAVGALRSWGAEVRGPLPAGLSRLRGIYRFHALVRAETRGPLHGLLSRLQREWLPTLPATVHAGIDVDPTDFA